MPVCPHVLFPPRTIFMRVIYLNMEKYHLSQFQVGEILIQTTFHHKSHDGVSPPFYQLLTKYAAYSYVFYFSFNYNFSLQMYNSAFLIQGNSEVILRKESNILRCLCRHISLFTNRNLMEVDELDMFWLVLELICIWYSTATHTSTSSNQSNQSINPLKRVAFSLLVIYSISYHWTDISDMKISFPFLQQLNCFVKSNK